MMTDFYLSEFIALLFVQFAIHGEINSNDYNWLLESAEHDAIREASKQISDRFANNDFTVAQRQRLFYIIGLASIRSVDR